MKADNVVSRYARKKLDLSLRLLESEDRAKPLVLIEGGPDALKMLAALLVAVADDKDKFSISPDGAGSMHFDPQSALGVYIHSKEHCDPPAQRMQRLRARASAAGERKKKSSAKR